MTPTASGPDSAAVEAALSELVLGVDGVGMQPWILDYDDHLQFSMSSWCAARAASESLEVGGVQRVYVDDPEDVGLFITERRSVYSADGVDQLLAEVASVPDRCSEVDNLDGDTWTWELAQDALPPEFPAETVVLQGTQSSGWVSALVVVPLSDQYVVAFQGEGADEGMVALTTVGGAIAALDQADRDLEALTAVGAF